MPGGWRGSRPAADGGVELFGSCLSVIGDGVVTRLVIYVRMA